MNTSAPLLPKHLYIDSTGPDGTLSKLTVAPDKLIAWSVEGCGDAIDTWCKHVCDKKIAAINAWEDNQILYLEDEWASTENDIEEEDEDEEEIRFHQACEVVTREAEMKREIARVQMAEHKAAIEKLVRQASASNATLTPPLQESQRLRYLIAVAVGIGIGIAVTYVLLAWQ